MRKKIIILCILMLFIFSTMTAIADTQASLNPLKLSEDEYKEIKLGEMKASLYALDRYNIVKNPTKKWQNEKEPIIRRNAFELVYIIYNHGNRFLDSTDYKLNYFSDIEYKTYDDFLSKSLWYCWLLRGKNATNESAIADFDSNITYYEALTLIARLFNRHWRYGFQSNFYETYTGEYPYFDFFEDIGLINNETIINYSNLIIKKEDLNKDMPAYEFMHLLYQTMFIPQFFAFEYPTEYGYRDINWYLGEYYEIEGEEKYLKNEDDKIFIPFELS